MTRLLVIAPAVVLILIGVASVAYAWGSNSGGSNAGAPSMAGPNAAVHNPAGAQASGAPGYPRLGFFAQAPVIGTVASKTGSTIVVTTSPGKTVTVDVSSTTRYSVRGVASATLDNIAVGDRIAAAGTFNSDGSLNATLVQVGFAREPGGRGEFRPGFGPGFGPGRGGIGLPTPAASGASL